MNKTPRPVLALAIALLTCTACATTPLGRLHQGATTQKIVVDGLGNTYLDICEQIVSPWCVDQNEASKATDSPWTKEDRVACLKPCDSETASSIQAGLDAVLAAQLAVFVALKSGEDDEAKVEATRAALRDAADHLLQLLETTGARKLVEDKLFGGSK